MTNIKKLINTTISPSFQAAKPQACHRCTETWRKQTKTSNLYPCVRAMVTNQLKDINKINKKENFWKLGKMRSFSFSYSGCSSRTTSIWLGLTKKHSTIPSLVESQIVRRFYRVVKTASVALEPWGSVTDIGNNITKFNRCTSIVSEKIFHRNTQLRS